MEYSQANGSPGAALSCEAMTRCECAGFSFAEIARRLRDEGATLDDLCVRTGCGGTCTACLPDLKLYLDSRR